MHDRRIMRGSTYAAMVIPAGTNPDAMVMDKNYPKKRTFKRPTVVSFSYFIKNLIGFILTSIFIYSPLRKPETYTQIVKFQLLNQSQVECIWTSKQSHTRKFLQISQQKESKELQLNSTWIDLQYHFSSQRCHQRKTVKPHKFMRVIMNFSISMKKLNQC